MKGNIHMKFDIVRAWKDETYRQSLSDEQLSLLPAHPAGELSDTDLATVCGGGDGNGGLGVAGSSTSRAFTGQRNEREYRHSLSVVICDLNLFSVVQLVVPII